MGALAGSQNSRMFELDDERVVGCLVLVLATAHCDDGIRCVGLEEAFETQYTKQVEENFLGYAEITASFLLVM